MKRLMQGPMIYGYIGIVGFVILAPILYFGIHASLNSSTLAPVASRVRSSGMTTAMPGTGQVSPHGFVPPVGAANAETDEVECYNPVAGTHWRYKLDVDRGADGSVKRVNLPNRGWKDIDGAITKNRDGTESFTDNDGTKYTIHDAASDSGHVRG